MKTAFITLAIALLASACNDTGACEHPALYALPDTCQEIEKSRCKAHTKQGKPPRYLGGSCESHGYKNPCPGKSYLKCK